MSDECKSVNIAQVGYKISLIRKGLQTFTVLFFISELNE